MKDGIVLHKNPNMVTRVIDDETILLPLLKSSKEINCIYTLNKSASKVWELINGKRTLGQIKEQVMKIFDVTGQEADKEIYKLLRDFNGINAFVHKQKARPAGTK